ncbi:MAG: polysaccharide pyruvyl transferase family protein [Odoribacter sp.]|nr:polysaccharide pyruvyl transferase family protein [Odoribacter sp.]
MAHLKLLKFRCRAWTKTVVSIRKRYKVFQARRNHYEKCLAHVTHYSLSNAGDTVLSSCIRDLFEQNLGKISWDLFSMFDEANDEEVQKFNADDGIVIGGHGAFLPDTNANNISGWEFPCSIEQYEEIEKPIIVFAVGYNYFRGQRRTDLFENNINALVRKCAFFGLRNTGSVREIQSFIDEDIKKKVVFQPCPTTIARYIYPDLPTKRVTHKVAFNVAMDRMDMRMGDCSDVILDQIAKSMLELSKSGYEVHFITHLIKEIDFVPYIEKYNFKYKFHSASSWDAKRLIKFYNEMDVVIGMRGHGIWIPFGVNCHIISLGNQNKTKWFLDDINAEDWAIDILDQPEQLCQEIVDTFIDIHEKHGDVTTKRLLEAQNELYETTCQNLHIIAKALGEKYK